MTFPSSNKVLITTKTPLIIKIRPPTIQVSELKKSYKKKILPKNIQSYNFKISDLNNKNGINENYKVGTFGDKTGINNKLEGGGSSVHNYLYGYIKSRLEYPEILKEKGIEGYVYSRIVFNKSGKYESSMAGVNSSSKYLKVLVTRNLNKMFNKNLPFNISYIKHKYLILDLTILFKKNNNLNADYIDSKNFILGRHFYYLIQDTNLPAIGLRRNSKGLLKLGVTPGDIIDWYKNNFTSKGKTKKIFKERQLENYKNDEAWNK